MKRVNALAVGGALAAAAIAGTVVTAAPAHASTVICAQYGSTVIGNRYVVQNNVWGASTAQCISVTSTGFSITTADHNNPTNGAPAAYPSIYYGCHYGNCSPGTILPLAASSSQFAGLRTSVGMSYPSTGAWDASYDIWFDPTPRTTGQDTGAEVMVWLNHQGGVQPAGAKVATVAIDGATWDVWYGNIGWNVVSYVRTSASTSADFAVNDFYADTVNRGYAQRSWYLTSVQAGFEPWVGGTGLAVNSFSVTTGGTPAPSAPITSPTPAPTPSPTGGGTPGTGGTGTADCRVSYRVVDDWGTGFNADVTITNTGTAAVNGWDLGFAFPGDQRVTNGWDGTWTQSGQRVAVRDAGWDGTLAPNASRTIGFTGAYSAGNPAPTSFTLNGGACATG